MPTCPSCRAQYSDDVERCPADGEALLPDEAFSGADVDLEPGTMVGEYRVEGKLGEGGFGAVYRSVHPVIGKTAAVKVLSRQWSSNPQMVSRFIAEARATNQIRHKNIIDIFAFGALPDGRQYYVMELLDGMPFDKFLRDKGRLAPENALPLLRSIARALDAAHSHGIVHRDLKPENVFLVFEEDGGIQPKLLDFGIAKLLGESTSGHKTRTGTPIGTPSYMSPEQCRGKPVDHRTDVYSLGVMVHEVLTGRLPFDGEGMMDVLVKHMAEPAPRMTDHCAELAPDLDEPVRHMLAKEPEERPVSAGAAIEAIAEAARKAGIAVAPAATRAAPFLAPADAGGQKSTVAITPGDAARIAVAKTVASGEGAAGRTFMPAETDVAQKPRRRTLLVAMVAIAGVAAGAAIVVGTSMKRSDHAAGDTTASVSPGGSAVATASSAAPIASSAQALSADIDVTVQANAPHASVWLGTKRLGDAPGPVRVARGTQKVTLVVKADGYVASSADVLPNEDTTVVVTMTKAVAGAASAAGGGTRINKELESPF